MEHNRIARLVLVFVFACNAGAQQFEAAQPPAKELFEPVQPGWRERIEPAQSAGKTHGVLVAIPLGVAGEVAATARDFATFHDKQWTILTFAQIGAATADAQTSLYNLRHCPTCREVGASRFVVGSSPDAHKYAIAGLVEITVEAVAAHYLRSHGPTQKWYWRLVWTLPQTLSIYGHAQAAYHNTGVNLGCGAVGQHC